MMRCPIVALLLIATACGDGAPASPTDDAGATSGDASGSAGNDSGSAGSDSGTVDAAVVRTSGCGLPAVPGTTTRHAMVNGKDRTYTVVIPAGYDPNITYSLVLRFHGFGATGAEAVGGVGLANSIIVGPDTDPPMGNTVAWNTSADLAFVDAIVDALSKELCVDKTRNFVTGYSNGGFMADAVGCHRSSVFRGMAIMESGSSGSGGCGQLGVYIQHNSDDMTVPISYGTALRDKWVMQNGCSMTSHAVTPAPCVAYDGCSAGHPVVWCNPPTGNHKPNYDVALGIGPFFQSL